MIYFDFPYHCSLCRKLYCINSWSLMKFRFHFNQSFQGPHALAPLEMISTISTTEAARKVWGLWWWDFVFCVCLFFFPAFFRFFFGGVVFLLDNSTSSSFTDELCDSYFFWISAIAIWIFVWGTSSAIGWTPQIQLGEVGLLRFQPYAVTLANGSSFRRFLQVCHEGRKSHDEKNQSMIFELIAFAGDSPRFPDFLGRSYNFVLMNWEEHPTMKKTSVQDFF